MCESGFTSPVTTDGTSARGIWARSEVGVGNSGIVGVSSNTLITLGTDAVGIEAASTSNTGNSGNVTVASILLGTLSSGAHGIVATSSTGTGNTGVVQVGSDTLLTTGVNAKGIVALSESTIAGNAGNVLIHSNTLFTTGAGATGIEATSLATAGVAGNVVVNSYFATITNAAGTTAIEARSEGTTNGNIAVYNAGLVIGGDGGKGINIIGGVTNEVYNATFGYINTFGAIATSQTIVGGVGDDVIENHSVFNPTQVGTVLGVDLHYFADDGFGYQGPGIYGNVLLGLGANAFNNYEGAYFAPGNTVDLGAGNLLLNQGIISPGHFYNVLTTDVTGHYQQNGISTYLTDFEFFNNLADRMNFTGTATLDSGVVVLSYNNPGRAIPGPYDVTILHADGGVTGAFDGLSGVGPTGDPNVLQTAVFRAELYNALNGNDVNVGYTINYAPAGLTGNQGAIGNLVNTFQTDADGAETPFSPVAAQLFFVPTVANLAVVYDSLSGEGVAGMQQAVFYARNQFFDATMDQMEGQAGRTQKYRVWVSGFGGSGHVNGIGTVGSGRNNYNAYGGALGLDMMVTPNTLIGLAVGGGRADFSVPTRWTSGKGDGWNVSLYGEANFPVSPTSAVYLRGLLSYGSYDMSETRTAGIGLGLTDPWPLINPRLVPVGAGQVRGSTNSDLFGGRLELGWRNQLGQLNVTPFASIQFDSQRQDEFSEEGYLGLSFNRRNVTSVPGALGVQLDGNFPLGAGGMSLRPKVRVSWVHEFETERSNTASFLLAPGYGFKTTGAPAVSDAARVDAGAQLMITPALSIEGGFTGYFAGRGTSVGGTGSVKLRF